MLPTTLSSIGFFPSGHIVLILNISGSIELPALGVTDVPKECAKDTTFSRSRVIPEDSQKKEPTTHVSQAGRKPSLVIQIETNKKAIAVPRRERISE